MATAEIIKLLVPTTVGLEAEEPGETAETITWENVAGHMAKLPGHVADYARAKYADADEGQRKAAHKVYANLLYDVLFVSKIAITENWGAGEADKLCQMAVQDDLSSCRCEACNGTASRRIGNKTVVCGKCGGSGRQKITREKIAHALGLSERHYYRIANRRYNVIMSKLQDWDNAVWAAVKPV